MASPHGIKSVTVVDVPDKFPDNYVRETLSGYFKRLDDEGNAEVLSVCRAFTPRPEGQGRPFRTFVVSFKTKDEAVDSLFTTPTKLKIPFDDILCEVIVYPHFHQTERAPHEYAGWRENQGLYQQGMTSGYEGFANQGHAYGDMGPPPGFAAKNFDQTSERKSDMMHGEEKMDTDTDEPHTLIGPEGDVDPSHEELLDDPKMDNYKGTGGGPGRAVRQGEPQGASSQDQPNPQWDSVWVHGDNESQQTNWQQGNKLPEQQHYPQTGEHQPQQSNWQQGKTQSEQQHYPQTGGTHQPPQSNWQQGKSQLQGNMQGDQQFPQKEQQEHWPQGQSHMYGNIPQGQYQQTSRNYQSSQSNWPQSQMYGNMQPGQYQPTGENVPPQAWRQEHLQWTPMGYQQHPYPYHTSNPMFVDPYSGSNQVPGTWAGQPDQQARGWQSPPHPDDQSPAKPPSDPTPGGHRRGKSDFNTQPAMPPSYEEVFQIRTGIDGDGIGSEQLGTQIGHTQNDDLCKIEVTGFKPDTSKDALELYFESKKRSKGGPVKLYEMKDSKCIITFEDAEVVQSVLSKKEHVVNSTKLTVKQYKVPQPPKSTSIGSRTPKDVGAIPKYDSYVPCVIEVTGFKPGTSLDAIELYFESNKKSKGGPVKSAVKRDEMTFIVTFEDLKDAESVISYQQHKLDDANLKVQRVKMPVTQTVVKFEPPPPDPCAIEVTGIKSDTSDEVLEMYFESKKKSCGGPIQCYERINEGTCIITFESKEVAELVLQKEQHRLIDTNLKVKPFKPNYRSKAKEMKGFTDHESCTILVTANKAGITCDALSLHFESKKRSGGGPVKNVFKEDPKTFSLTFEKRTDTISVLQHENHTLNGIKLSVRSHTSPMVIKEDVEMESEEEPNCTVEVTGFKPETSQDALELYFESKKRSGGGTTVSSQLNNGVFTVTFETPDVCERVLKQKKHTIGGATVTVKEPAKKKKKPNLPRDTTSFLLRGLADGTSRETLELYLETCTGIESETPEMFFGEEPGTVMVKYSEELQDFDGIKKKISKRTLSKVKLVMEPVHLTNCILVCNIPQAVTEDTVQLYFESTKRSGGGEVQEVQMNTDKCTALVYFEDYTVVDKVLGRTHKLSKAVVDVQPYIECLGYVVSKEAPTARMPDPTTIDVDVNIMNFIMSKRGLAAKLEDTVAEAHAKLVWPHEEKNNKAQLVPDISEDLKDQYQLLKDWKQSVSDAVYSYLRDYKSIEVAILEGIWLQVISQKSGWQSKDVEDHEDEDSSVIVLTGQEDHVNMVKGKIESLLKDIEDEMQRAKRRIEDHAKVDEFKIKQLLMVKFPRMVEQKCPDLKVTIMVPSQQVKFEGLPNDVMDAKCSMYEILNNVPSENVKLSDQSLLEFLKMASVSSQLHELMHQRRLQATYLVRGENITYSAATKEDLKEATKLIQSSVHQKMIPIQPQCVPILNMNEWNGLISDVEEKHLVTVRQVQQRGETTVVITGFHESVSTVVDDLQSFIKFNTIVEHSMKIENGKVRYILEYRKADISRIEKQAARTPLQITRIPKGIVIKGTEDDVKMGSRQLQTVLEEVHGHPYIVEKPGMAKLFQEEKGKNYLSVVERNHNCKIDLNNPGDVIMSRGTKEGSEDFEILDMPTPMPPTTYEILCFHSLGDGRRIIVGKGDLTKMPVDAIVNSANPNLDHSSGGLTKAISDAGGPSIQEESKQRIKQNGRFFEGQVCYTGPGNLPCKTIIHAVGPSWNKHYGQRSDRYDTRKSQEERLLEDAVQNSLKMAERLGHTSIAIPAISSGAFGFPLDLCAQTIIAAVKSYCSTNAARSIMEIRLVDNSDKTCHKFQEAMVKCFGEDQVTVTSKEEDDEWSVPSKSRRHRKGSGIPPGEFSASAGVTQSSNGLEIITAENKKIRLVKGSIAQQKANVIVNTTQTSLDLNTGAVSKAILQTAGPQLQQLVNQQGAMMSPMEGDIIITGGAGLKCVKVYHVLCCKWDGGKKSEQLLRGIMRKCFDTADQGHVTSICIPAIGTGGLGFPRDFTAKVMYEEAITFSRKNPRSAVSDIRFVVYDKDWPTIKAFESEISRLSGSATSISASKRHKKTQPSRIESVKYPHTSSQYDMPGATAAMPATPSASSSSGVVSLYTDLRKTSTLWQMKIGSICVQVQQGDITTESTDAIVNSTNENLDLSMGAVSKAIIRQGGRGIQHECDKYGPQRLGSVVVTTAGRLKCKNILHLVSSSNIENDIITVLNTAEQSRMSSIALPAIGTGGLGINSKEVAAKTLKAIANFYQTCNPQFLSRVKLSIFQPALVKDFQKAMTHVEGSPIHSNKGGVRGFIDSMGSAIKTVFGGQRTDMDDTEDDGIPIKEALGDTVVLYIYAGCENDIKSATVQIEKMIADEFADTMIAKDTVSRLPNAELSRLKIFADNVHVKLEKVDTGSVSRLRLQGGLQAVMKVQREVDVVLDQISEEDRRIGEARILASKVKWLYLGDEETFEEYEEEVMGLIEKAHMDKKPSVVLDIEGGKYKIDFTAMTEEDLADGSKVFVRRELKEGGFDLPQHWVPMADHDQVKRVTLNDKSPEYATVATTFMQSLQPQNVVQKIERIQSPKLYRQYMVLKQSMDRKNKKTTSNERLLYHGTGADSVDKINHGGFNRSFAGKNATYYGAGSYFAVNSSYSASVTYSPPDPSTFLRYVYQAKVLTGEYTRGAQGMLVPPSKSGSDPTDCYDSVTDNVNTPSLFVVFNDAMAYPEYLITFT